MTVGIISSGHISDSLVRRIKKRAEQGVFNGDMSDRKALRYFLRCRHFCENTEASIIYTRDVGYHTSGWWKNPDYERCYHLSLAFVGRAFNRKIGARWCEAIFGDNTRLLWAEPPYSKAGKKAEVYHFRLFCDPAWQPIKPRGEVYSTDWTPADWKSYSDVMGAIDTDE